jgi:hypothetical protein
VVGKTRQAGTPAASPPKTVWQSAEGKPVLSPQRDLEKKAHDAPFL